MTRRLRVVVVSYNTRERTERCIQCVLRYTDVPYVLWIVDNGSSDGSAAMMDPYVKQSQGLVRVIALPLNVGYSRATVLATTDVVADEDVCFLNSDVYVGPSWASRLRRHLDCHPPAAAVAPLGRSIGGWQAVQSYHGMQVPDGYDARFLESVNAMVGAHVPGAITAKCLQGTVCYMRGHALLDIGGLDTDFPCGADDADWSLRARVLGYDLLVALDVIVWHDDHSSFAALPDRGATWIAQGWAHLNQKWKGQFDHLTWDELMESRNATAWPPYQYLELCGC